MASIERVKTLDEDEDDHEDDDNDDENESNDADSTTTSGSSEKNKEDADDDSDDDSSSDDDSDELEDDDDDDDDDSTSSEDDEPETTTTTTDSLPAVAPRPPAAPLHPKMRIKLKMPKAVKAAAAAASSSAAASNTSGSTVVKQPSPSAASAGLAQNKTSAALPMAVKKTSPPTAGTVPKQAPVAAESSFSTTSDMPKKPKIEATTTTTAAAASTASGSPKSSPASTATTTTTTTTASASLSSTTTTAKSGTSKKILMAHRSLPKKSASFTLPRQSSTASASGVAPPVPLKKRLSLETSGGSAGGVSSGAAGGSSAVTSGNKAKQSRIRSLKLPMGKKVGASSANTVQATVLPSDEEDGAAIAAVATVVQSSPSGGTTMTTATKSTSTKRSRSSNPSTRPVRIPPIASPGLLVPQSAIGNNNVSSNSNTNNAASYNNNNNNNAASPNVVKSSTTTSDHKMMTNATTGITSSGTKKSTTSLLDHGWITPETIFEHHMKQAGYTKENRTQRPHRGSSTTRVVGDMFDSNVKLSLHFPPLVPPDLLTATLPTSSTDKTAAKPEGTADASPAAGAPGAEKPVETEGSMTDKPETLPSILIRALQKKRPAPEENDAMDVDDNDNERSSGLMERNRQRQSSACAFESMLPVSLTVPYPETYIEKRLHYIQQVQTRERAIVARQEAEEEAEMRGETLNVNNNNTTAVVVPPIPEPPSPPIMKEMEGFLEHGNAAHGVASADAGFEDRHPIYLSSKAGDELVKHLDKNCFHITNGRYFGLMSNNVADPNFVGANAPGITCASASGGAGLATATTGAGGTATALTSASFHTSSTSHSSSSNVTSPSSSTTKASTTTSTGGTTAKAKVSVATNAQSSTSSPNKNSGTPPLKKTVNNSPPSTTAATTTTTTTTTSTTAATATATKLPAMASTQVDEKTSTAASTQVDEKTSTAALSDNKSPASAAEPTAIKVKQPNPIVLGPTPTATATGLRMIMEEGGSLAAEAMRECIIRAAVHASRTGGDGQPFVGSNGEVYPDISKAFGAHTGVKPCPRCKNNKQGAYHCRLRRKHQESDFDGGDSFTLTVRPLFDVPLESLLIHGNKNSTPSAENK